MSPPTHTYGPTCYLSRNVTFSGSKDDDEFPHLKAHFFYSSPLPIDDPLSAAPIPESKAAKHPPRPFSAYDNNALEEAWMGLSGSKKYKRNQQKSRSPSPSKKGHEKSRVSTDTKTADKHGKGKGREEGGASSGPPAAAVVEAGSNNAKVDCSQCRHGTDTTANITTNINNSSRASMGNREDVYFKPKESTKPNNGNKSKKEDKSSQNDTALQYNTQDSNLTDRTAIDSVIPSCCADLESSSRVNLEINQHDGAGFKSGFDERAGWTPEEVRKAAEERKSKRKPISRSRSRESRASTEGQDLKSTGLESKPSTDADDNNSGHGGETGTTGRPFLKLPSRDRSRPESLSTSEHHEHTGCDDDDHSPHEASNSKTSEQGFHPIATDSGATTSNYTALINDDYKHTDHSGEDTDTETIRVHGCKAHKHMKDHAEVPVGVSRLHLVKLPTLQMKPIYWSPVHDIASVTRGTWFYKDSMYPVEPAVANQLEIGYKELRPWSKTWTDELNSAIEVGAHGEEKIAHRLWPKEIERRNSKASERRKPQEHTLSTNPYCAAKCFHGEASAEGTIDPSEKMNVSPDIVDKKYAHAQIIYKDAQHAFILKPNVQPSAYYGRKPLAKIMKGIRVGLHVVRGFDWKAWDKLHPSHKSVSAAKAEENAPVAGDADTGKRDVCAACRAQEGRQEVTDLVLVVHGIGQKLSERVESFHFTHAINSFRRSCNVELNNDAVKKVLRKDLGGIMVLPVNWRSNLSFEDGGPMREGDQASHGSDFSLKDITLDTLPAVRNMISDVMLDIPFYMSQHKPKMISAVITEANRVYRLWCKNNPDFHGKGRVHVIAHSLGSAMAMEVLSKQPNSVPKLHLSGKKINTKHFDFKTTNLFFAGSPAGFFLLLEKGKLTPRRGLTKPGTGQVENDKEVAGDAGQFGCMAVDNIYNIMSYNDPIAYRLNATVDHQFAETLKNAQVPSASTGFFKSIGNAILSSTPGTAPSNELAVGQVAKPATVIRLPSQLEMDVHDFSREEIAEQKFYLLNDNGQVDWFLSTGGGPLEIQYLNMLSAHSSYWGSPDFVRMIVTECGREPGKTHTLPNMRAVKKRALKSGRKSDK